MSERGRRVCDQFVNNTLADGVTCDMVMWQGGVTGVNIISPQDSGGLGLGAQGYQVINIFHLLERGRVCCFFLHSPNNSGNVHQILLSGYFKGAKAEDMGKVCPRKVP